MGKKRVTVTLEDADIKHVEEFKSRMGTNFSEALRFIVRSHKFTFGDNMFLPPPDVYERMRKIIEER